MKPLQPYHFIEDDLPDDEGVSWIDEIHWEYELTLIRLFTVKEED